MSLEVRGAVEHWQVRPCKITRGEFLAYYGILMTGVTNMLNIEAVSVYSGLPREKVLNIIKHYDWLRKKYLLPSDK